ncbi:MAG: hypothetical protein JSW58_12305 [Candidatus Latescibacterota bacterium]|nr:MAG: hypothetical protein JSW58_12305 [Candidatus Latescibacterota bacterium]
MPRSPNAIFYEEQRLRENKLVYLAFLGGAAMIVLFGWAIVQQIILGEPFGDRPMGDTALLIVGPLYILLGVALLYIFFEGRLVTEVRPDGLFVRFIPFHRRFNQIPLAGVARCEARTYRPIREYGGWGIRGGVGKKAYNVSGNQGVELEYDNGKKLLIGSKKAGQLASAIESISH